MENQAYSLQLSSVGADVMIWPQARVINPGAILIGDSVIIDDFVLLMGGARTSIGSFVHIASFCSLTGGGEFVVEDFAGISSGTRVFTGNDDYLGGGLTGPTVPGRFRNVTRSFVHVQKHAIIGANSVILPGVTVGQGAAVGAQSLVKADCEPWTVYVGCPARPVAKRSPAVILQMEEDLRATLYDQEGNYVPRARRIEAE